MSRRTRLRRGRLAVKFRRTLYTAQSLIYFDDVTFPLTLLPGQILIARQFLTVQQIERLR